jgi:hypothetical protein
MGTTGVEGLIIQTRNWGKTVAFWRALGYQVEFQTGRISGRTSDADGFEPPRAGTVEHPFTGRHWGAAEMLLCDPDGRHVSVQVPLPAAAGEPATDS